MRDYHDVFETIERDGLDSNVSVKLTALGLNLGYEPLPREPRAGRRPRGRDGATSSGSTWRTRAPPTTRCALYRELRAAGLDNVGVVLQARLRRTLDDVRCARRADAERPPLQGHLRRAPRSSRSRSSRRCARTSSRALDGACSRAARTSGIATHDEWLIDEGKRLVAEHGRARDAVRVPDAARACASSSATRSSPTATGCGSTSPYGEHWYAYSLRRLQENPKIAGYIAVGHVRAADSGSKRLLKPLPRASTLGRR